MCEVLVTVNYATWWQNHMIYQHRGESPVLVF